MNHLHRWAAVLPSLILLAVLTFARVPGVAALGPPVPPPVLGVDPLPQGAVVEIHAEALSRWVERGFAGAVLLHIGMNHDLWNIEAGNLAALKALRDRGDIDALARAGRGGLSGLFHDGNFIRAAAGLGVVREVVWVIPFTFLREVDASERLKAFLGREGLSPADVGTFQLADGCYRGTVGNLPVAVCGQDRLPRIDTPVLLSLDIGFIPCAADFHGLTFLTEMRSLFAALRAVRYSVQDAVVAYTVHPQHLPVELRWIGEAVVEILHEPALALADAPPERWTALQQLYLLKVKGPPGEGEMLDMALSLLEKHPHDPALLLFAAEASARHGGGGAALSYAEQACSVDQGYCVGLREIGLQLSDQGNLDAGARFFAAGERLRPGMEYRQFDMGIALWRAGRPVEALDALGKIREHDGAFPSGFVIGAMHAALGDRAAARLSFDNALAVVERTQSIAVSVPEVAQAIQRAAAFYREAGLTREAALLETDPRLQLRSSVAAP